MRTPEQIAFAERMNRSSWEARRRLLAKGEVTGDQVAFMDDFDAKAMKRWQAG
jgi:hypothetical protein